MAQDVPCDKRSDVSALVQTFGFDPRNFGSSFKVLEENFWPEGWLPANVCAGDLIVTQNDVLIDPRAIKQPNFLRMSNNGGNLHYAFAPLKDTSRVRFDQGEHVLKIDIGRPCTLEIRDEGHDLVLVVCNPETGDEVEQHVM